MHERFFTKESFCRGLNVASKNNTSQITRRIVGLVERSIHQETLAVVFDAFFMIIQSKS